MQCYYADINSEYNLGSRLSDVAEKQAALLITINNTNENHQLIYIIEPNYY